MKRIILVAALALSLASCAEMFEPQMFGMSESRFKALPPKQQEMVIKSYNEREKIRTENEAINNAISAASFLGTQAIHKNDDKNR